MTDAPHRPRAFRLDDPRLTLGEAASPPLEIEPQADAFDADQIPPDEAAIEEAQRQSLLRGKFLSWGALFWSALGGLVTLAFGLWINQLIEGLFARAASLGWLALGLAALAGLAAFALLFREYRAIRRQKYVARLHIAFADAHMRDDSRSARRLIAELTKLYAVRPETAAARSHLANLKDEIIDGRDLIRIAEHNLIKPLDARVRQEIAEAAKRTSLITAIAPRAVIDVMFVAAQAIRLIRRISEIYGGKPGFLGFLRLARTVTSHLAITGGMAVGDSLLQQMVGHGIAARLSAKLGEGMLNGLMTARVGISAMSVCRPMPFSAEAAPGLKEVAPFLFAKKE